MAMADTVAMAVDTVATAVDTVAMAVATDTARGLLMLRLSPAMAATAMEAMVATGEDTARGLLRLRLSPDTAMEDTVMAVDTDTVATAVDMAAMAVATTARGLLMLSPRL